MNERLKYSYFTEFSAISNVLMNKRIKKTIKHSYFYRLSYSKPFRESTCNLVASVIIVS